MRGGGLYHYPADHHCLARVSGPTPELDRLLAAAAGGMAAPQPPQVLVVMAARYERIAWKYGPIAYSLVLKNVGVVMELLYLTATAMGLAGCAVGSGDPALFARATGLDRDQETSVGEFCVGSAPAG